MDGRDSEGEVTPDKGCWSDTATAGLLEGGFCSHIIASLPSNNSPPWEAGAPPSHPQCLRRRLYGESQAHPMSSDLRSVLTLVWQLFAHTLFLSAQGLCPPHHLIMYPLLMSFKAHPQCLLLQEACLDHFFPPFPLVPLTAYRTENQV